MTTEWDDMWPMSSTALFYEPPQVDQKPLAPIVKTLSAILIFSSVLDSLSIALSVIESNIQI